MTMDIGFSISEADYLQKMGVEMVVLFGSQAQGLTNSNSDYDFGVIVNQKVKKNLVYDYLYELLSKKINKLVNIDIVFLNSAPAELLSHISKYGKPLFLVSKNTFANFKQRSMIEYSDFAYYRQMFQEATLDRITT